MGLNHLLARKKSSSSSLRGKPSEAGSVTSSSASDLKPRDANTYKRTSYETVLASKGSFMDEFDEGIEKASSDICQTLLYSEQTYPENSLFRDDRFSKLLAKIFATETSPWLFEISVS